MSDVKGFVAKCERMATAVPDAQRASSAQAGQAVEDGWLAIAAGAGLTPGKPLRNVGRAGGARWGVSYSVGKSGPQVNTLVRFTGPVQIVLGPDKTRPHVILARRRGTRTKGRAVTGRVAAMRTSGGSSAGALSGQLASRSGGKGAQALVIAGDAVRAYAMSPGSRRHHIYPELMALARRVAPTVFSASMPSALLKAGFGR